MIPAWEAFIDPLLTTPESNSREHWHKKAVRHHHQRDAIRKAWKANPATRANLENTPLILYIQRIAPRKLDCHDNLTTSLKSIVDEICNCLMPGLAHGQADSKLNLKVAYAQAKGLPKQYAVKIKIFTCENLPAVDLSECEKLPGTSHCICKACHSVVEQF